MQATDTYPASARTLTLSPGSDAGALPPTAFDDVLDCCVAELGATLLPAFTVPSSPAPLHSPTVSTRTSLRGSTGCGVGCARVGAADSVTRTVFVCVAPVIAPSLPFITVPSDKPLSVPPSPHTPAITPRDVEKLRTKSRIFGVSIRRTPTRGVCACVCFSVPHVRAVPIAVCHCGAVCVCV